MLLIQKDYWVHVVAPVEDAAERYFRRLAAQYFSKAHLASPTKKNLSCNNLPLKNYIIHNLKRHSQRSFMSKKSILLYMDFFKVGIIEYVNVVH